MNRPHAWVATLFFAGWLAWHPGSVAAIDFAGGVQAQQTAPAPRNPFSAWRRVLLLRDYNTRMVVLGTMLLGCAGGMVGSFALLRKRALMGDALSHATLPGIALAFIAATQWGWSGKSLPVLLLGATVSGLFGVGAILAIRHGTKLKEDTALGAVLSIFFGAGVALLGVVQQMPEGHAAGLESFIYGKTASLGIADLRLIAAAALSCALGCVLLFKEWKLLCFDDQFAGACGFPVIRLDIALMGLVVLVTIVGLQAVGLILMIALLVIPAAAARFWTERMGVMFVLSAAIGGASGVLGAMASALFSRLPSGAMIVLTSAALFVVSLFLGTERGLLVRWLRRRHVHRSVDRQHLLRAIFEILEMAGDAPNVESLGGSVALAELLPKRSWSPARLAREIRRSQREELIECVGPKIRLTPAGRVEAARLTRQHRLWELYLIHHADVAPSQVDRDADAIEHVLEPQVVAELEDLLQRQRPGIPRSPHELLCPPRSTSISEQGG